MVTNNNDAKISDEDNKLSMKLEDTPVTVTMETKSESNVVSTHTIMNAEVVNINKTSDTLTSPIERTDIDTIRMDHVYFRGDSQDTITGLGALEDDEIDEDVNTENAK